MDTDKLSTYRGLRALRGVWCARRSLWGGTKRPVRLHSGQSIAHPSDPSDCKLLQGNILRIWTRLTPQQRVSLGLLPCARRPLLAMFAQRSPRLGSPGHHPRAHKGATGASDKQGCARQACTDCLGEASKSTGAQLVCRLFDPAIAGASAQSRCSSLGLSSAQVIQSIVKMEAELRITARRTAKWTG